MTNPQGTPVWYELLSAEPDASEAFYQDVLGWKVQASTMPGTDYRMIDAGADDFVGGLWHFEADQADGSNTPGWRVYFGVDDVDATIATLTAAGGIVKVPAFDLPDVGRMAYVADPQGIGFYMMRGASDQASSAWDETGMGKCSWNELATPDQAAANAFYADVFGWSYPDKMPMGELGDYWFIDAAGQTIGATMPQSDQQPKGWLFYFRAPDIEVAAERVKAGGGTVHSGPMEVPGGDRVIVASDPHGVAFGVVGPGQA